MSTCEQSVAMAPASPATESRPEGRNVVLYVGGFGLPDWTASAHRCLGNAKLLRSIGYEVVIMGKLSAERTSPGSEPMKWIEGFPCYEIRAPFPDRRFRNYVYSADSVEAVAREIGTERIHSLIAYNYPATALSQLIRLCERYGIRPVVECADWYGWEGKAIISNVQRLIGAFFRSRVLAPRAGNVILVSRYLVKYYEGRNVLVLPFVVDARERKWFEAPSRQQRAGVRRLVYAGSPGLGLRKDKLNFLIESLANLAQQGFRFHLDVVGISEDQYLDAVPRHRGYLRQLAGSVVFHGRVPHLTAIELQHAADFAVFFRYPDRVANVGFPTKFVEATSCGIPTITNPTSDIADYLVDGINGLLARSHSQDDIERCLRRALEISEPELAAMRSRLRENPFHYERWQERARRFMRIQEPAHG
jgi:glycosyltransferase involved in cell wall biosynthesis